MNGKEVSQPKHPQAHLLVIVRGKVFASVAHARMRVELAQLNHAFDESQVNVFDGAGA